ncbi:MAG: hypothetical protein HQK77_13340 [Desulfobacterales bacterium]|nr:hypothetical protein [Desulfobacterales bacterium]
MPYVKIETTKEMDTDVLGTFSKKVSSFVANMLSKPETYIMVSISKPDKMLLGGDELPSVYMLLKSINLPVERCSEFTQKLCDFFELELRIQADRIYIDFSDIDRKCFGWNRQTF